MCDALDNPLRFVLTAGQRHDPKPVPELLDGLQAKALLADKAGDLDKIVQAAERCGMQVIIPCRVNRKKNPRVLDTHRYQARHLVENFFQHHEVAPVTFRTRLNGQSLSFMLILGCHWSC